MSIDLSYVLKTEFHRARKEYEKAVAKGNTKQASSNAEKCARLLRQLADNVPRQRASYLAQASKWEEQAKSISNPSTRRIVEKEPEDTEFDSIINGLISKSSVTWEDIGGLEEPKRLLMETVVINALKKPDSIQPWRGIMFFGPPGTGKTLLAAAAAGSLNATFFNVSIDKILSKYYGETSKLIASLYEAAESKAENTPSIVFIDEFDSLVTSRTNDTSEASRKSLGSLLDQMDGFKNKKTNKLVLTITATNAPWALDEACLSRFPQRIYVPLPDINTAKAIIIIQTKSIGIFGVDITALAGECVTRQYSGRDITFLCQQAMWSMIRKENKDLYNLANLPYEELNKKTLKTKELNQDDFSSAFENIKSPMNSDKLDEYQKWAEEFGVHLG